MRNNFEDYSVSILRGSRRLEEKVHGGLGD